MAITASRCSRLIGSSSSGCRGRGTTLHTASRARCAASRSAVVCATLSLEVDRQRERGGSTVAPRHLGQARQRRRLTQRSSGAPQGGADGQPLAEGVEHSSQPRNCGASPANAGSAPSGPAQQRLDHGLPTPAHVAVVRNMDLSMRASIATQQSAAASPSASLMRPAPPAAGCPAPAPAWPPSRRPCAAEQALRRPVKAPGPRPKPIAIDLPGGSRRCSSAVSSREAAAPGGQCTALAFEDEGRAVAAQGVHIASSGAVDGEQAGHAGQCRSSPVAARGAMRSSRVMLSTTLLRLATASLLAAASAAVSARLPGEVYAALDRASCRPTRSSSSSGGRRHAQPPRGARRPAVNPASLTKLLTTYAALELLGPAWSWNTPVWLHGTVNDGVLEATW